MRNTEDALFHFAEQIGHVSGILKVIPDDIRMEAVIDIMVAEAIRTSEIESEYLSRQDVVSFIRNNLGLNQTHDPVKDRRAQGASELMVDVQRTYAEAMTEEKTLLMA
ncbi:DUF4172 domain-containing protein [Adhaeribacter arboris]|uniref:DUF4172 domain-containing protein n=1 Tax=Adhaeribacter arboris TaxID=2072846 RepID=UPI001E4FB3AE|nr:DUF4172 domain-containing protein [Adhaeribacter arboris]